jgi:putative colanic acid biosynthesis acetyltransferase WcaF
MGFRLRRSSPREDARGSGRSRLARQLQHSSHDHHFADLDKQGICLGHGACPNAEMIRLRDYDNSDFDRGAPGWKESLWVVVKCAFFLRGWPWPNWLRVSLLRFFGSTVGERVVIRSRVNVTFPWRLTLGDDVWLGEEVLLLTLARVTIENDVCLSQRAFLCTGSHDYRKETFDLVTRPITIRRGSWIAAGAFIGPGVEIGPGSVVSAGAVVLESIPEKSMVRGNPATRGELDSDGRRRL